MAELGAVGETAEFLLNVVRGEHAAGSMMEAAQTAVREIPEDHAFWRRYYELSAEVQSTTAGEHTMLHDIDQAIANRVAVATARTVTESRGHRFFDVFWHAYDMASTITDPSQDHRAVFNFLHSVRGGVVVNLPGDPPETPSRPTRPTIGDAHPPRVGRSLHHINLIGDRFPEQPNMPSSSLVFPKSKKMTMRWSGRTLIECTVGSAEGAKGSAIKLNSIVNPGASLNSADNHEPMGYTQMAAIYDQYVVTGARLRVDYAHNDPVGGGTAGALEVGIMGITPVDESTTETTIGHYEEIDTSVWQVVGQEGTGRLDYAIDPVHFFGVPKNQARSDNLLKAAITADPTNTLYAHVWFHYLNQAQSSNSKLAAQITVEYDVVFMEPKKIAQS